MLLFLLYPIIFPYGLKRYKIIYEICCFIIATKW